MNVLVVATLAGLGVMLLVGGAVALGYVYRQRRSGRLLRSDARGTGVLLRSPRYRLSGRPDELRELTDGRRVPVEVKSRPAPVRGPPRSHRVQVSAYSLLVEETSGRPPPYGLLRYGDGQEFRIDWTPDERADVLAVRRELSRPYDGRARPSPARCARCPWRASCDAAAA